MKLLIAFVLSVLLNMGAQAMAQEIEYQFGVRWSVNGLASSVDMQNIMLDFKGVPSEQNMMLPATEYIRNGRNEVQFYAWPVPSAVPFESHHELRLSLEYWEPGQNPNIEAKTAFEVVLRPGQDNPAPEVVKVDDNAPLRVVADAIQWDADYFRLEVPFTNRQPMPTWCWEEGDVLKDNDTTRDSLTREYRRLHALFAAGDNEALLDAASTRTEELALASGTPEAYVRDRFSYTMYFDNPDLYQLNPFPDEPMTLNLGADNRVAWLTTEGVQVPIRFNHVQENDVSSRVRPYFIRRDGQWEICR
ncbi:hypothetical protein [Vreelandella janggokensis]|uniref:Uncharacterized protein n=1 Tax=Vreelandella janggokensis TaxID=370767 RepID=A0ABT4IPM9_9GAMM|nr:hypothetical protein [Halomonas janggokensis]MCZ0925619.1 hypothetical protein [Halomonas janggokensis]